MRLHRDGGTNRDSDRIGGETGRRAIALVSIRTRRAVARRRRSPQYLPTRAGNARALRRRPPQRRLSEIAVGMDFSWLILLRIIDCEPPRAARPQALVMWQILVNVSCVPYTSAHAPCQC